MQSHKSIVPGALGRRWIWRLFRVQKRQYFTPTFGDAHLKRHFESWKISSSISLHVCIISDWYKILPGCYSLLVVWNLKIPTHSGGGWVDVTAGLWKTDVTEFQVDWGTGSSNSDICDLGVCSWVGLYLRTLRFWRNSVGWSDKSLSQFEAREDTPHSVKLEGLFLLGVPIGPEVFPWSFNFLPFQLAGEVQDGVDSKDGNELQRFVIRHGNRLATRNQLHGVVMLWWLRCCQRPGMILSCILLPAFGFIIPQFQNNSHVNLSICAAKFVRSLWLIVFRNFNSSRL